ncbi:AsmA family protein [Algiphilus aromaticivorans]|uniref:AsmA family protein n=1 Tax=Algiphilus aromaticivorans TaxID=382454 RepID=UPI0005C179A4|nr:AsmA family protein [Algiphilus aromaticivorans]
MRKFLKIAAILVAVVLLVVSAALATAVALFDPNDYREQIGTAVEQQTGRSFSIDGDLSLRVFPWLAVGAEGVTLGNAEGFGEEPFAQIGSVAAGIKLLPLLLRREVVLDEISLEGLRVNLAVDAQGRNNWADLAASATEETAPETDEPITENEDGFAISSLEVSGIRISDAALSYTDAAAGVTHRIKGVSLSTGRIRPGEPFNLSFGASYSGGEPTTTAEMTLSGVIDADIEQQVYELRQLALDIIASGEAVPGGKQNLAITGKASFNAADGFFSLSDGRMQTAGITADFNAEGKGLNGDAPSFSGTAGTREFSPRAVLSALAIEAPATRDNDVLKAAKLDLRFKADSSSVSVPELTIRLDDTQIKGEASLQDLTTQRINFSIGVDAINIDRYLPPDAQVSEQAGKDGEEGSGDINDIAVPTEMLEAINAKGRIRIGELIAQGMTMRDVVLEVDAPKGSAKTQRLTAKLYGGNIDLSNTITPGQTPRYSTRFKVASVAGGDLLADFLGRDLAEGLANAEVDLSSRGKTVGDIRKALNGTLSVSLSDGAVKGFDIAQTLRNARRRLRGEAAVESDGKPKTDFASLVASAKITDGLLEITKLDGRNPLFRLLGDGTVNLVGEELDVLARPSIVKSLEGQAGAELSELAGIEIPIRVSGSWADPKIRLDLRKALEQQAASKLREAAGERGDELREKVRKEEGRLQEKIDKEIGEKAGDALRSLFGRERDKPADKKQGDTEGDQKTAPDADVPKDGNADDEAGGTGS